MPSVGVEPTLPCGNWILSPARLPIPPQRQLINLDKDLRLRIAEAMPSVGVEPTLPYGNWILSPARLPIPPQRQYLF